MGSEMCIRDSTKGMLRKHQRAVASGQMAAFNSFKNNEAYITKLKLAMEDETDMIMMRHPYVRHPMVKHRYDII